LKRIAQKMPPASNNYPNGSKKNDSDGNYSDDE